MNDIDDLWHDLPVGPAPLKAILREGQRTPASHARRAVRRGLATAAGLATVAAAFALGTTVNGDQPAPPGSPHAPGSPSAPVSPVGFHGQLRAANDCDALTERYRALARDRVSPWGWTDGGWTDQGPWPTGYRGDTELLGNSGLDARTPMTRKASGTGTNTQEAAVDEPDVVKTDGTLLARVRYDTVTLYDVSGPTPRRSGQIRVPGLHQGELLLVDRTVVVIGRGAPSTRPGVGRETRVVSLDVSDPSAPRIAHTSDYDSGLVAARQHDSTVRLVLNAGRAPVDLYSAGEGALGRKAALQRNRDAVEATTATDWLPTVSDDGEAAVPLVDCTRVALPAEQLGLDTVTVVGFEASAPQQRDTVAVLGEARTVYVADDRLFLAGYPDVASATRYAEQREHARRGRTQIFDFALDGTSARYLGSGAVRGYVKDRWSMDFAAGTLRVVAGRNRSTRNHNAVVVLAERGRGLVKVARLEGLGRGEDVKAVRWFDDLAVVVTYRTVDPLYTVDLSNPSRPRLLGELKIPGYSQYLHPVGESRLLGLGVLEDRGWTAQAALFDTTDLTRPRQRDRVVLESGTYPMAAEDPRTFTWLPEQGVAVAVINRSRRPLAPELLVLRIGTDTVTHQVVQLPRGTRAEAVRVVPVGDSAVLVAGQEVRRLEEAGTGGRRPAS